MADATTTVTPQATPQANPPGVAQPSPATFDVKAAALLKADADLEAAKAAWKAAHEAVVGELSPRGCINGAKHAVAIGHTWHIVNGTVKWTPVA